jgi:hypothetical protein
MSGALERIPVLIETAQEAPGDDWDVKNSTGWNQEER